MIDPVVQLSVCGALAWVWVGSGIEKLRDLPRFRRIFADYRLLPTRLSRAFAPLVAMAELGLAAGLLWPAARPTALLGVAGLLSLYSAAIALNLARGRRDIDCGCAGPQAGATLAGWLLLRNAALVAAALACRLPQDPRPLVWLDALSVLGAACVLVATWSAVHGLAANAGRFARSARPA